jgi:hypothetical protein
MTHPTQIGWPYELGRDEFPQSLGHLTPIPHPEHWQLDLSWKPNGRRYSILIVGACEDGFHPEHSAGGDFTARPDDRGYLITFIDQTEVYLHRSDGNARITQLGKAEMPERTPHLFQLVVTPAGITMTTRPSRGPRRRLFATADTHHRGDRAHVIRAVRPEHHDRIHLLPRAERDHPWLEASPFAQLSVQPTLPC